MKTVVIVDGSNFAFGMWTQLKDSRGGLLTSTTGIPTTIIYGLMRSFNKFAEEHDADRTLVAWDVKGGSQWRKNIFRHYKANRYLKPKDDLQPYYEECDSARHYLEAFGIKQIDCEGIEADDVIGWFSRKYLADGWRVILWSNDKDYKQLVKRDCKLWRPCIESIVTTKDVVEETGLKPCHLYRLDALVGQDKDNIPGACDLNENNVMKKWGFGPGFAMKILAHDLNPNRKLSVCKQLLKSKDNPLKEAKTNQLLKNWKQVLMSAKIARLRNQDKHFQKWELKRLDKAYQKTRKNPEVRSKDIAMLAQNLDIVSVNVPQICTRLGVNVTGKRRKSSGGIKV